MKILTVSAPVGCEPGGGAPSTDFNPLRKYSIVYFSLISIREPIYLSYLFWFSTIDVDRHVTTKYFDINMKYARI